MAIPNSTYTEALSTAVANYSDTIADNITKNNALLAFISKNGNVDTYDGGTEILQNIAYPGSVPNGWYSGAEVLDVSAADLLTSANFAIKQAYTNVTFTGLEKMIHSGKSAMHNFVKSKLNAAGATLDNTVGASLFYSNTESGGKAIGGLQHLVSDTNNSGTIGGIDASAQSWWQNYVYDFSVAGVTASATTMLSSMNAAYQQVTFGKDQPDLIVAGATYFGYFEAALQVNQRFMSADDAQAGFMGYKYKNAFATYDSNCSATRLYMLNTKYFHFRPHKDRNFVTDEAKMAVNQDAYVVPIFWGGNLTISGRRNHAVMTP